MIYLKLEQDRKTIVLKAGQTLTRKEVNNISLSHSAKDVAAMLRKFADQVEKLDNF